MSDSLKTAADAKAAKPPLTLTDLRFFTAEIKTHIAQLAKMMNDCEDIGMNVSFSVNKVGATYIPDVTITYRLDQPKKANV